MPKIYESEPEIKMLATTELIIDPFISSFVASAELIIVRTTEVSFIYFFIFLLMVRY